MVELEPLGGGDELPPARDCEEDADIVPIHDEACLDQTPRAA
jgi:hypothetical protein